MKRYADDWCPGGGRTMAKRIINDDGDVELYCWFCFREDLKLSPRNGLMRPHVARPKREQ